ncbi:MAG: DUF3857 domain-containing protein [Candidatus Sericytochromatia bacterium]|nr:DUF3857 domain-containing protein [Candidatus Sericytochromatia bacterium]
MPFKRWIPVALASLAFLLPVTVAGAATESPTDDGAAAIDTQLDETEVRLGADGSFTRRLTKRYKVLNERGKKLYAEAEFGYRPDSETVTIDRAFTVDPDGQTHQVQANAIADASPYSEEPAYDRYRVKSFTLPAMVTGSVCEYQVTIRGKNRPGRFSDSRYLQGSEPADTVRYILITPSSLSMQTDLLNAKPEVPVDSQTTQEGDTVRRVWTAHRPKPLVSERQMPRWRDVATRIAVSSTTTWRAVSDEWRTLSHNKAQASSELVALTKQVTAQAQTPSEKAKAIYDYVLRDIRYVAVDMTVAGFEPQSASQVYQNRYGDCKDGSTLLKAMLTQAGIPTHYVLVSTNERGRVDQTLPNLSQFDHCIVAADLPTGRLYLDSVAKTTSFGDLPSMDHGADALLMSDTGGELVTLPGSQPGANVALSEQTLTLMPGGGVQSDVREQFTGTLAAAERQTYVGRSPQQISDEFRRQSEGLVAGSRLLTHRVSTATEVRPAFETAFTYASEDFATVAGDLLIFKLPGMGFGLGLFSAEHRDLPISWWTRERYIDRAEVTLPQGYRPRYLPAALVLESPEVGFTAQYTYLNGRLSFEAVTDYKATTVSPQAYASVRKLFLERARFAKSVIILERDTNQARASQTGH